MLFVNKTTSSSLFSVGPSVTHAWANSLNKPNPAPASSIGLWSAPPRNYNPPKLNLFKTQNPHQTSNLSILSNLTVDSKPHGNNQVTEPESPGTPTFGPLKGSQPHGSLSSSTIGLFKPQVQENRPFAQSNTKRSNVFWQMDQSRSMNNRSPLKSIINLPNQRTQAQPNQESQVRSVSPSKPAVNNKNGLPFSWTSPSRPSANFLFKPRNKPADTGKQALPQDNNNLTGQNFANNNELEFFKKIEARVNHKDYKDSTFMQGEELPYNIFDEGSSKGNYRRFNENMRRYYNSHRNNRGNDMEEEQFHDISFRTKKELTALNYSSDLVRMLKGQEHKSDRLEIESDMIVYIIFLDGNNSERTIAVDVSSGSSCLELKKAVLGIIFGAQEVNWHSFKLHRNGELLEESKSLCEQSINTFDYLVLEKI